MAFEVVYKVPESQRKETYDGRIFIKLDALEEHALLYFLRKTQQNILHDTPVVGNILFRLKSSEITGPAEAGYYLEKEQNSSSIYREEVVEFFVPKKIMPVTFEPVSYVKFGLANSMENEEFLISSMLRNRVKKRDIVELATKAIKTLSENFGLHRTLPYHASSDGQLIKFILDYKLLFGKFFTSESPFGIDIDIFGKSQEVEAANAHLRDLKDFFVAHDIDACVENYTMNGLAYNFSIDKKKSLEQNLNAENVVI